MKDPFEFTENGIKFFLYLPGHKSIKINIEERSFQMKKNGANYSFFYKTNEKKVLYSYILEDGTHINDPKAFFLPQGIYGKSLAFKIKKDHYAFLKREPYREVIYEMHLGTFTKNGTWDEASKKIPHLKKTGISIVEIMPIHEFFGKYNWGYDPFAFYAPCSKYGTPENMKAFIDKSHSYGIKVILDVVFNHVGPYRSCLHYWKGFFKKKKNPWGKEINFKNKYVCDFFVDNIIYWIENYNIDGFRFDAVDFIHEDFFKRLKVRLKSKDYENIYLFVETSKEKDIYIKDKIIDAKWDDSLFYSMYSLVTDNISRNNLKYKRIGFLKDYLKKYSSGNNRNHSLEKYISFIQNHDQIGNRPDSQRLLKIVDKVDKKMMLVCLQFLSPFTPMIFMGEEYGELSEFNYFVDVKANCVDLLNKIKRGRKKQFLNMGWKKIDDISLDLKKNSFLTWKKNKYIKEFYIKIIKLRKEIYCEHSKVEFNSYLYKKIFFLRLKKQKYSYMLVLNFSNNSYIINTIKNIIIDSNNNGVYITPFSFRVYKY